MDSYFFVSDIGIRLKCGCGGDILVEEGEEEEEKREKRRRREEGELSWGG